MIWQDWKSALMIVQPETVTLASQAVQTVLVEVYPNLNTWSSSDSSLREWHLYRRLR
jgi:hypothetical protein